MPGPQWANGVVWVGLPTTQSTVAEFVETHRFLRDKLAADPLAADLVPLLDDIHGLLLNKVAKQVAAHGETSTESAPPDPERTRRNQALAELEVRGAKKACVVVYQRLRARLVVKMGRKQRAVAAFFPE